ncbi:MAG: glycosyl transferase family 2, partial [Pseudomonadota bacterium]|nr:glycosyl transferase family 2 [Pseudomonadota bacterium]
YFEFALDDPSSSARRLERLVRWRNRLFGLPYGDQGLLISKRLYSRIGGYRDFSLMEDVDIVRRLGRKSLRAIDFRATTSAVRFQQDGYWVRPMRNLACLALFYIGVPLDAIKRVYG